MVLIEREKHCQFTYNTIKDDMNREINPGQYESLRSKSF